MNLNHEPKHELSIRTDQPGLVEVRHRALTDPLFLTIDQGDEFYARWPETRAAAVAEWDQAIGAERQATLRLAQQVRERARRAAADARQAKP